MNKTALALFALFTLTAGAQGGAAQEARAQPRFSGADFDEVNFARCYENPGWMDSMVRASLVVHPDGVWVLALDGALDDPMHASLAPELRRCMEETLVQALGRVIPSAPRASSVFVRTFDFRIHHEDPAVRQAQLQVRFDGVRAELSRCVLDLRQPRVRVRIHLRADGRVEVTLPRPDVNRGLCITNQLGTFMPGAEASLRETIEGSARRRAVVSGEGGLCGWGEHRGPPPVETEYSCAAGLHCCPAGGAPGSDSICMRTANCPPYP